MPLRGAVHLQNPPAFKPPSHTGHKPDSETGSQPPHYNQQLRSPHRTAPHRTAPHRSLSSIPCLHLLRDKQPSSRPSSQPSSQEGGSLQVKMLENGRKVFKEGLLEKRSDGLLQLWKKKHCVLTEDGVLLLPPKQHDHPQHHQQHHGGADTGKVKELHFANMKTVDCVERKGKYVYFTVVMTEGKEIDFRCPQDEGWNAEITLQMVQYKNRQAILAVKSTRQKQQLLVVQMPGQKTVRSSPNVA
ncbi:pleckstrin homology-like domain family A member 1 [Amphiprion ocellaris]|uniref:Pleckstrin homology-like domain, family A, member 1 n=1 Tax=Amphiprion ocellaris TaxID=80972 RepID=A0AAQ5ZWF7_AMPOC|nr:pleckstrin homology-like domain family A member 1 [Amphiprion ocellaris]